MKLHIHTSTVHDGSMKYDDQITSDGRPNARDTFLLKNGIQPADTTLVYLAYDGDDYRRYYTLSESDKGIGITGSRTLKSDALVTTNPGHALFLPLADCIAAVIHDPVTNTLMLSHLGRHNIKQIGGTACIQYLIDTHHVNPADLQIWLSPAAGSGNYPLYDFDNRGLHDVAAEQLTAAGVLAANIKASSIDTTTDQSYYSHSEFKKGNRPSDGRFAVVTYLSE
ncbi:hypothetical protein A2707_05025 [Candidatus Saccharibacteria bacterium RIFCSPHIGHO2_01_FULL_45_15]|nr:MAG: hypothetical protein A2707_05025 [Candidatus Saccharibacteria bacterium RIFCSPHIGHO2_01_FULL_45_15]OGL27733.1 MAG: hypothetical protein A3C39_04720 [Candidatus Saccharibacteria bacterium RIFCSPHIGHO2_02_FULL_46_12]OGL32669.1 MAG: hypothetical protein A3E76_04940 [Candidatus Saccharibacteria bacterium RIFCSPHIGHO2_12_FULL_44_22]